MKSNALKTGNPMQIWEWKKKCIDAVHGSFIKTIIPIASVNHSPIIMNIKSFELIFMEKSECSWPNGFI